MTTKIKSSASAFALIVIIWVAIAWLLFGCEWMGSVVFHDPGAFTEGWAYDSWTKNTKLNVTGKTFNFDFPNVDGVHTIEKKINGLKISSTVSMTYEITGNSPTFAAAGDVPTVGFYIGKGRIYSNGVGRVPLRLGKQTLSVPLTPDRWQTVDGFPCNYDQAHINEFQKTVTTAVLLGPCFGDNHGFAHGANLTTNGGSAHFNCISFAP